MLIKKQKIKINLSRYLVCVIAVILCVCTLPIPSAKAARALFSDDFENGLVNWEYKNRSITDASFSEAKEQQNTVAKLEISEKTSGFHRFLTMGTIENFDDASIEFDVKDITGGRGAEFITIFLRANDDLSQYYAILINYAGTISLAKNIYTASNIPGCSVKASAGGYNLSVWNHFRIDTVGNKIDVYINNSGTPVLSYTDTDSPNLSGSIGFMVRSGQRENNIVHFDNVVVNPVAEKTETSGGGIGIARDLKDNELAKKAMLLANLNIMNYDSDDNFLRDKVVTRGDLGTAIASGEGLFNLSLEGSGYAVLSSACPMKELYEINLENDCIKIDGNNAICWSKSLAFTVERSGKSLIGSAASGEGLVNVYRGTGKILVAPLSSGGITSSGTVHTASSGSKAAIASSLLDALSN